MLIPSEVGIWFLVTNNLVWMISILLYLYIKELNKNNKTRKRQAE